MVLPIVSIFREDVGKLVAAIRDRIPLMASVKSFGVEAALSASDVRKVAEEVSGLPHAAPGGDQRPTSDNSVAVGTYQSRGPGVQCVSRH